MIDPVQRVLQLLRQLERETAPWSERDRAVVARLSFATRSIVCMNCFVLQTGPDIFQLR